jgi:iron complex outermembrane recepter protein
MIIRSSLMILVALASSAYADEAVTENNAAKLDVFELPDVEVVGTTPLGATGLAREKVSSNVQSAEDEDIKRHEALELSDFMRRRMGSVNINDVQNNPFQPDVTFRGFSASPILGTPIGLSVYQDGVRVNEAFGDTVNWDLIPKNAIANIDLIPGSNPLFGLNTLGGALSVRTKSGFSHTGTRAQAYGGSFGRKAFEAEHGGSKGDFDWFLSGNVFEDEGWRPFTHSAVNQAFGKVGWENDNTDLDFSFTFADNRLTGVGPVPANELAANRRAIYTAPDTIENTLYFFNLKGEHRFSDDLNLAGNSYYRGNATDSLNSNTGNVDESCETFAECIGLGQPPASNVTNRIVQGGTGINLQLTSTHPLLGHENQLTIGGGYNTSHTHFSQAAQNAVFSPEHVTIGATPLKTRVDINGDTDYGSLFATDTLSIFPWLHANAALGWNTAAVVLQDKLGTELNGEHSFDRLNPSAGFTMNPLKALDIKTPLEELTIYGNYNEGFRAPTPIELSCANPDAPCTLPNGFTDDPPLKPVVSKTFEVGVRGKLSAALQWTAAVYRSRSSDDILFRNASGSNVQGYFQNVGLTQRQGVELGLSGVWEKLSWYANYSFVDATYQSTATLRNAVGEVNITPGKHLPGIPQQNFKLGAEYEILSGWFFGSDLQYSSNQYLRGDDDNSRPKVSEYAIVNLNTRYAITKNVEIFAMAKNIFDSNYETYGTVNQNFFNPINGDRGIGFLGPGAPISGWAGVRVKFD